MFVNISHNLKILFEMIIVFIIRLYKGTIKNPKVMALEAEEWIWELVTKNVPETFPLLMAIHVLLIYLHEVSATNSRLFFSPLNQGPLLNSLLIRSEIHRLKVPSLVVVLTACVRYCYMDAEFGAGCNSIYIPTF